MKGFFAFFRKEFMEYTRNYKLVSIFIIFFAFGMMSPLLAKLAPEILKTIEMQGMSISMPEATVTDAYLQFFKNISQMGLIIFILMCAGTLSGELSKGTLINLLTKGLSRNAVIFAKFLSAVCIWSISIVISFTVCYGYTAYLFHTGEVKNLFLSLFCMWLFGLFIVSLILFSSTISRGTFGGLTVTAVVLGGLLILNIFPAFEKYNPASLSSYASLMISGAADVQECVSAIIVSIAAGSLLFLLSMQIFRKKRI